MTTYCVIKLEGFCFNSALQTDTWYAVYKEVEFQRVSNGVMHFKSEKDALSYADFLNEKEEADL